MLTTLSIEILRHLASDLLKRARGAACSPIDKAIAKTVEKFANIQGLKFTLDQWLQASTVKQTLEEYTKGLKGLGDVNVEVLAENLLTNTQFYMPEGDQETAREIVSTFLAEVREEYLRVPELGLPIIGNRLEDISARMATSDDVAALNTSLEEMKARPSTDATSFDLQVDEAREHIRAHRYELAQSVCDKLRSRDWDRLSARQKFRTLSNLALAHLAQDRTQEAARLLIEAKEWQPDDDKAVANEAWAYDLLGQKDQAFEKATQARDHFPNSALALRVWINAAPPSYTIKDLEDAVPSQLSGDIEVIAALAFRALAADDCPKAEALARRGTSIKPDWSLPWALLGKSIFRSALPDTAEDYSQFPSLAEMGRLQEADDACTKAIDLSKKEKQTAHQADTLLVRAEIRRALMGESAGDEDVVAARLLLPKEPVVLREYARMKLRHGEEQDAIQTLRSALKREDHADLRMLLAIALGNTGKPELHTEATQIYINMASDPGLQPSGYRMQAIVGGLDGLVRDKQWEEARAFIAGLPGGSLSPVATAAMRAKLELAAENREGASELATKGIEAITDDTTSGDLRLLALLLGDLGRNRDALPLWQRLASRRHLDHDTTHLIDCALRVEQHDIFFAVCEQLRSNGVYDKQLVQVEAGVRAHYDIEASIGVLQDYLGRFPDDSAARLQLSAMGLQLGRSELIVSDPSKMPSPEEVRPEDWKLMVLVMKSGGHTREALRFAYAVLRDHFPDSEAHRAYLAAMMTGQRPDIPMLDIADSGVAVAFQEEGSGQEEWRVIEDEFEPKEALQEIGPDHYIARQVKGKRVGETFLVTKGSLVPTEAAIRQVVSKYVYRYRDCAGGWERRFPELPDIQSVRVIRPTPDGGHDVDVAKVFAVLDRMFAGEEDVIAAYRSQPIPIHLVAKLLGRTEFGQMIRLAASDEISIRCCLGSADERGGAISSLKNANSIVLDLTSIATLCLLEDLERLKTFPAQFLITDLTYAQLKTTEREIAQDVNAGDTDVIRFLGREEGRYVFHEAGREILQERGDFLRSVIKDIQSLCKIVGSPELAALPPDKRNTLVQGFGEHGAQTLLLAARPGHVLWTDDFAMAMIARHEFGARRIWTQAALQERAEAGAVTPNVFFHATAKLMGMKYYFTSASTPALARAGILAAWNPGRQPLKNALELFGDKGIATIDALHLAISFMRHYANEVVLPETRSSLTIQILENLAKRGQGSDPIKSLLMALPAAFGINALRAGEFVQVVRAWIRTRQRMG